MRPGTTYGKWTTTSIPFLKQIGKRKECYVQVKCECGTIGETKKASLLSGKSSGCRSCGKRYHRTDEQLKETAFKSIVLDYKDSATIRGLCFDLTNEEIKALIFCNCFYCGSGLSNSKKNKHIEIKYNGIDRVDNSIGYQVSNCVSCCKMCNIMKSTHDGSLFMEHIAKILKNNSLKAELSTKKLIHFHERAVAIAAQSHDIHTQVAALLVNPKTLAVSADGYNGFVREAADELLPTSRPEKYDYMVHAEANLLCNAVRNGVKTDNCFVYVSISPCTQCLRLMWQAGIKEFYFKDKYKDFDKCTSMLDLKVDLNLNDGFYHMIVSSRRS